MADKMYKVEFRNTLIWIILAFAVSFFLAIAPDATSKVVYVYAGVSFVAFLLFIYFPKISKYATYKPNRKLSDKLLGVNEKPVSGFMVGLLWAVGFVAISSIKAFSILNLAIPLNLPFSLSANGVIILLVSWVCETAFFGMIYSVLTLFMGFWTATTFKSLGFSAYHYWTYVVLASSTITNAFGAFVGAFVFSMLGGFLIQKYGLEAEGGLHFGINSWNYNKIFGLLTVLR